MGMRPLKFPGDLLPLADMIVAAFQYPENPEWGIQADEEEDIAREIKTLRKLWPLFRIVQLVSPAMRDLFRGFVWEEDGKLGAVVLTQRRGTTKTWVVGVVGVLPEFRRRGIARKLLTHTLEDLKARGAERVGLGVIEKNVPAYSLYKSLGFEHFSSMNEYHLSPTGTPETVALPSGFTEREHRRSDWRSRYELEKRITPATVAAHNPVEEGRFRTPIPARVLEPIMNIFRKLRQGRFLYMRNNTIVGRMDYQTPGGGKGTSAISARLDPEQPELASYMLSKGLRAILGVNPKLRVHFTATSWMPPLVDAAEAYGFELRVRYHMLGMKL